MASETPVEFDDDNPEWTEADVARARPIGEHPALAAAFPNGSKPRGRPPGSEKEQVTLRIDRDTLDRFRAGGAGWQTRINDTLRQHRP